MGMLWGNKPLKGLMRKFVGILKVMALADNEELSSRKTKVAKSKEY